MSSKKQLYYFDLIEQWEQSSLVKKDFCLQHNIKPATFQYWITKYHRAKQQPDSGFVALTPTVRDQVEIIYPNGVRIQVSSADTARIAQLLHLW